MICFFFQPDCKDPVFSEEIFWLMLISFIGVPLLLLLIACYIKYKKSGSFHNDGDSITEAFSDDIGPIKQYPDTIIQVQINGWSCLALIDTGCPISLINKKFVYKMKGKFARFYYRIVNLVGLMGIPQRSDTLIKTFMKVENKKFKIRLQVNNSDLQTPYDIILGKDFLMGKIYSSDELNEKFTISNTTTKIIDVNNIPEIKIAVGQVNGGYVAKEGVSKPATHPLYMYDSVEHPGITFSFAWKRNLKVGSTYYCTHCESAKKLQKSEGRPQGQIAIIHIHERHFSQNPDRIPHICLNENVHASSMKTEATQVYRKHSRNLRENPAPPMIAYQNLNNHINRTYGANAVHVTNNLPQRYKMNRVFNLNSAFGRPDDVDLYNISEAMQLSPHMLPNGTTSRIVRYFNRDRNLTPFVIMMDSTNLKCIHMATDLTFDGTFQYAPDIVPNGQIYTMHASYHELPDRNSNFLVGIAIIQNRDTQTYEQIFTVIREQLIAEFGNIGMQKTIHMDHEIAAITAAENIFPEWTMHSCYFHFGKNLRNHIGQVLLGTEGVGRWFSALCGSCHLPLEWQREVVAHLILNLPQVPPNLLPKLGSFAEYFQRFWEPKLPLVNFYGKGGVRTTNAAEGFHNSLNTLFANRQHPSFTTVFIHLRELLCSHHAEFSKYLNGDPLQLRARLFRQSEAKIIRASHIIHTEFANGRHPGIEVLLTYSRHVSYLSTPKVNMEDNIYYNWEYQPPYPDVFPQPEEQMQPPGPPDYQYEYFGQNDEGYQHDGADFYADMGYEQDQQFYVENEGRFFEGQNQFFVVNEEEEYPDFYNV